MKTLAELEARLKNMRSCHIGFGPSITGRGWYVNAWSSERVFSDGRGESLEAALIDMFSKSPATNGVSADAPETPIAGADDDIFGDL